jgi:type III restriction enzyme
MPKAFFEKPILNSPYEHPGWHWELDGEGQPTHRKIESRRPASFITPIPKPKKQRGGERQAELVLDEGKGLSTEEQQYHASIINDVRRHVGRWRQSPESRWNVTPETARLLNYWRHHSFESIRPFFCQVEAVETAIWLSEVAPNTTEGKKLIRHLDLANDNANPGLSRLALKLATGAGKTTVMAMIIAWQTINSARRPSSRNFTRGFLIVTPGLTIRDRLRVLQPNDPDNYYRTRDIVPRDLLEVVQRAKIVITNYHAFKLRERLDISSGGRALLRGRTGPEIETLETEGQMIQRVMPELMGLRRVMVVNDEAHHCYREKPPEPNDAELEGEDRQEAEKSNEAARLWISGIEAVSRKLGVARVLDLSATPFFLKGSGYREATLFPWVMSDFSLMDAIESGIVKLPRVPVAENITGAEMPVYRNLWEHIGKDMPRKGRGRSKNLDPLKLPTRLKTALQALYGHYAKTFDLWREAGVGVPPCFIIVCQNTAISKLIYDFVSGFYQKSDDGVERLRNGALELFRNFDENDQPLARPNTLLIDSEQLEAGDALDAKFRDMAGDEIERFRREIVERTGSREAAERITDQDLLREVMNTVGKSGQLGEQIRCVVSVSMLTEGWDANNVTHILGVRAFGTQLLCEQVIGRALRRQSYELNADGLFDPEYADIFGIPFDFTAEPVVAPPRPPIETITVRAVRPDRDDLEIRFPRVEGYRVELPRERLVATFTEDSVLELTPDLVGPSSTRNAAIIGETADMTLEHLKDTRQSTLIMRLTQRLLETKWRDPGGDLELHLFGQLKRITRRWLDDCLKCKGQDIYPALLLYEELADMACDRITAGITRAMEGQNRIKALLDPYNPTGSTAYVRFNTSRRDRWRTDGPPPRNHVDWVILDSDWEAEFCRVAEAHPRVVRYTKNHSLGLEVPYRFGSDMRRYRPDFIVAIDDGHGPDDLLQLVVEIKGYRREDAKIKKETMETRWVPGVNNLGSYGRWDFAEFVDIHEIGLDFEEKVEALFETMIEEAAGAVALAADGAGAH